MIGAITVDRNRGRELASSACIAPGEPGNLAFWRERCAAWLRETADVTDRERAYVAHHLAYVETAHARVTA